MHYEEILTLQRDNENETNKKIEKLEKRVTVIEDKIILLTELENSSAFNCEVFFRKINNLAQQIDSCGLIVDVSIANLPDARTRRWIYNNFQKNLSNIKHLSFVSGKNVIINTTIKIIMKHTSLNSFSIHKTIEEGVSQIKKVLNE